MLKYTFCIIIVIFTSYEFCVIIFHFLKIYMENPKYKYNVYEYNVHNRMKYV